MSRFEGKLCPVCRTAFKEDDEVAVCPDCGTPHHRACYLEKNECALSSLHGTFSWNGRLPDEPVPVPDLEDIAAIHGETVDSAAKTDTETDSGSNNGTVFDNIDMFSEEFGGDPTLRRELFKMKSMERGEDGVSMRELVSYTTTSIWHYSRAFFTFRGAGGKKRRVFLNICCGLFAPIFQFYRKMELLGVAVILCTHLSEAAYRLLERNSAITDAQLDGYGLALRLLNVAVTVLLCVFGDYLFYRRAVKNIIRIRREYEGKTDTGEYYDALSECGRPSVSRALLGFLAWFFAAACVQAI